MRSLRPLHSKYISECNAKIDRYTEQVGTQVESVHHLFLLLGASDVTWQSPIVTLSGIKQIIDGIKFEGTKYYYNNDEITANEFVRIFKQELAISEYKSGTIPSEAKVLVAVRENDTCYLRHCNDAQLIDGEVFLNFFYDEIINYDTYCFLGFF